jgi:hypothetical protein
MCEYKEHIQTFETEVGQVDIIHIWEDASLPDNVEIQVWVNKSRMHLPERILKQTSQTLLKKVCETVKTGTATGTELRNLQTNLI